jgi:peptidoglycan/LPS O-acetylase OafA/YrhL
MANSHPYLNNLTPLRGIAALWVAAYHFKMSIPAFSHVEQTMLLNKGYMMVDLFFIMSGFIIRHVYGDRFSDQITKPNVRHFFVARIARIYPLHIFTLALLVFMTLISGEWNIVNDPAAIPTHVLLLQSFGVHQLATWNRASWSISAEWAAYIVFPLLAMFLYQAKRLAYTLLPILVITSYIALLYWLPPKGIGSAQRLILHQLDVSYDYGFLRGIAGFTLGMLSYGLYMDHRIRSLFSSDMIAVIFIAVTLLYMHEGLNDLFLIIAFTGVVLSFACNCGCLHKFCSIRPVQFIGKVSYSIYLIQWFVATFFTAFLELPGVNRVLPPLETVSLFTGSLYIIAYLAILVAFSSITYHGVENPCRNFINRNFTAVKQPSLP